MLLRAHSGKDRGFLPGSRGGVDVEAIRIPCNAPQLPIGPTDAYTDPDSGARRTRRAARSSRYGRGSHAVEQDPRTSQDAPQNPSWNRTILRRWRRPASATPWATRASRPTTSTPTPSATGSVRRTCLPRLRRHRALRTPPHLRADPRRHRRRPGNAGAHQGASRSTRRRFPPLRNSSRPDCLPLEPQNS